MQHESDIQKKEDRDFLNDPDAEDIFAKLDYALKDGVHIQGLLTQSSLFRFINKHYGGLKLYYQKFYGVNLEKGGEDVTSYYYLDFSPQSRGNIHPNHRYFMQNEYVIIGFLLYKIIYIDMNIELNSVKKLQKIIRQDYEDLKPGIYRTLAKVQRDRPNPMDDEKVDKIIIDALQEFNKIAWITLVDDHFEVLSSFQRINRIYMDYINNLDSWLLQN